ncbi:MAG: hypothetical protein Q9168_005158 [Polycauliona sp. 1 TL-2023]
MSALLQDALREKRQSQSSPIVAPAAIRPQMRTASGPPVPREMGLRETNEYISDLTKQNFNLKLELYQRKQRDDALEAKLARLEELASKSNEQNNEYRQANHDLLQKLDNQDQAIKEAVALICQLEAKVARLEQRNSEPVTPDEDHELLAPNAVASLSPKNAKSPGLTGACPSVLSLRAETPVSRDEFFAEAMEEPPVRHRTPSLLSESSSIFGIKDDQMTPSGAAKPLVPHLASPTRHRGRQRQDPQHERSYTKPSTAVSTVAPSHLPPTPETMSSHRSVIVNRSITHGQAIANNTDIDTPKNKHPIYRNASMRSSYTANRKSMTTASSPPSQTESSGERGSSTEQGMIHHSNQHPLRHKKPFFQQRL